MVIICVPVATTSTVKRALDVTGPPAHLAHSAMYLSLKLSLTVQTCLGGQYCDASNLTAPSGDCAPGYYCTRAVDTATPSGAHTGEGDICPAGHFCPGANADPIGCPPGYYQVHLRIQTII